MMLEKEKALEMLKMLEVSITANYEMIEDSDAERFNVEDIFNGIKEDMISILRGEE